MGANIYRTPLDSVGPRHRYDRLHTLARVPDSALRTFVPAVPIGGPPVQHLLHPKSDNRICSW